MTPIKRLRNLDFALSAALLVFLLSPPTAPGARFAGASGLLLALLSLFLPDLHAFAARQARPARILIALAMVLGASRVFHIWHSAPAFVAGLSAQTGLDAGLLYSLLCALLSLPGLYAALVVVCFFAGEQMQACALAGSTAVSRRELLVLFVTALGCITVCSKSSPLYPMNDWVDANCFFTVGRSMLSGKVLYRDIFEQKGFYLYALHVLAALISDQTFLGVYLLEIAAAFLFLLFSYKTVLLFCSRFSLRLMPVFAALIFASSAFCQGDSAEELCLPLLALCLYVGLRAAKDGDAPTLKESFVVGLCAGVILFVKFSILGFFVGWFVVPAFLLLRRRELSRLLRTMAVIAAGVAVASLPVLAYFLANGALRSLLEVYFYDNIFVYALSPDYSVYAGQSTVLIGARTALLNNPLAGVLLVLALIWLSQQKNRLPFALAAGAFVGTLLLVYSTKLRILYYAFVFAPFVMLAAVPVCLAAEAPLSRLRFRPHPALYAAASLALCLALNNNAYLLLESRESMPQYQFREIVQTVEEPTMLNYGFLDGGFYTVCGIVPSCRFFCGLNIPLNELREAQDEYLAQGEVDFVVTCEREIDFPLYTLVAQCAYYSEGYPRMYRLYERSDLL